MACRPAGLAPNELVAMLNVSSNTGLSKTFVYAASISGNGEDGEMLGANTLKRRNLGNSSILRRSALPCAGPSRVGE
jgi:hypothetical protein